jgi:hypothetical protein
MCVGVCVSVCERMFLWKGVDVSLSMCEIVCDVCVCVCIVVCVGVCVGVCCLCVWVTGMCVCEYEWVVGCVCVYLCVRVCDCCCKWKRVWRMCVSCVILGVYVWRCVFVFACGCVCVWV